MSHRPESSLTRRLVAWVLFVALISAVAFASNVGAGPPDRNVLYLWSTAASEAALFAVIIGVTLAIAGSEHGLLALRRPPSWPRAILYAAILLALVYGVIALVDPFLHGAQEQGLTPTRWEPHHAAAYVVNSLVVAGLAPVAEESLFRGLGFSLLRRAGKWPAILIVGVAFGAYHGLPRALPELAFFGCALAWLRARTGSVLPGMLLHATFNAIALAAAVAGG